MARIRRKGSKLSYGGLGLLKEEDKKLVKKLRAEGVSLKAQIRKLLRSWLGL